MPHFKSKLFPEIKQVFFPRPFFSSWRRWLLMKGRTRWTCGTCLWLLHQTCSSTKGNVQTNRRCKRPPPPRTLWGFWSGTRTSCGQWVVLLPPLWFHYSAAFCCMQEMCRNQNKLTFQREAVPLETGWSLPNLQWRALTDFSVLRAPLLI